MTRTFGTSSAPFARAWLRACRVGACPEFRHLPLDPQLGVLILGPSGVDATAMEAETNTIPATPMAPFGEDVESQAERRLREAPKCTVLVVDDDEGIRTAMAEILELLGYEVSVAADGQEAVEMLKVGLEPRAIVLDMMMPRMDGWTFLSRIRADPRFRELPVVVASAVVGECPAGADAWLQKPFDLADLDREVARLCAH